MNIMIKRKKAEQQNRWIDSVTVLRLVRDIPVQVDPRPARLPPKFRYPLPHSLQPRVGYPTLSTDLISQDLGKYPRRFKSKFLVYKWYFSTRDDSQGTWALSDWISENDEDQVLAAILQQSAEEYFKKD